MERTVNQCCDLGIWSVFCEFSCVKVLTIKSTYGAFNTSFIRQLQVCSSRARHCTRLLWCIRNKLSKIFAYDIYVKERGPNNEQTDIQTQNTMRGRLITLKKKKNKAT